MIRKYDDDTVTVHAEVHAQAAGGPPQPPGLQDGRADPEALLAILADELRVTIDYKGMHYVVLQHILIKGMILQRRTFNP